MLVLSRKVGESIQIGDEVTLVINRISGNRITIAIQAPREVKIVRGELTGSDSAGSGSASKQGVAVSSEMPASTHFQESATSQGGGSPHQSRLSGLMNRQTPLRRAVAVELDYDTPGYAPRNAR